ncbi:MAG TPA: hypothetical protein VNW06_03775, partial [Cytophagaceae bacterium]|nr:hypothetical protein [Cytophagaceae bacterium]
CLIIEITSLKGTQVDLLKVDFDKISIIKTNIDKLTGDIGFNDASISLIKSEIEELKIPLPDDGVCKHCRQPLTDAHRRACVENIKCQINEKTEILKNISLEREQLIEKQKDSQIILKELEQKQKLLTDVIARILSKDNEIIEKKKIYEDHSGLINKFDNDLLLKKNELEKAKLEVESSSEKEIDELKHKLSDSKKDLFDASTSLDMANKSLNELNSRRAVSFHSVNEKIKDIKKKSDLEKDIKILEEKYTLHPIVIQAFDEIPDMIIENVLEDLQGEANNILTQIRPGLQLSFSIEKTKDDGTKDDTLEINYFLNNKPRDYSQLSGAQRVCVLFSLKLGLSFLLAKTLGTQIMFLLLDEIDQSLDKAGVDAFADIIKFFQKDFTILVITHNDRLKDKFSHAILVEQDQNMVSRAKVVSSW